MQATKLAQMTKPNVLRFPIYASERRALLILIDVILVNMALLYFSWLDVKFALPLSISLRFRNGPTLDPLIQHPEWFVVLTALWIIFASMNDCYDLVSSSDSVRSVFSVAASAVMSIVAYTFVPYISPPIPESRFDLVTLLVICASFVGVWRVAYVWALAGHRFSQRVLILGAGYAGKTLAAAMRSIEQHNYVAVGFVDDDKNKVGQEIEDLPVLGTSNDLTKIIEKYTVDEVVLAISNELGNDVIKAIVQCNYQGIPVTPMPLFHESITGMVPVQHIGQNWVISLQTQNRSHLFPLLKRLVDILVSLVGLLFFIIVFPFIAIAIKLTSPGSIFYQQVRLGRRGKHFKIIKFRTMYANAEADGKPKWASKNDARITSVGRFLRRTHLDEMPQLINVFKGEMSFIGPRPERPEITDSLQKEIPFYRNRMLVRPGVTGWAQVKYGYGSSVEDALLKLQYDLYYIKHASFYLDSVIAYKTLSTLLRLNGR